MLKNAALYVNNNGMVCCLDHGGSYLMSAYQRVPERNVYVTPLDCWERIGEGYVEEWTAVVGTPPRCEFCP